MRRDPTYNNLPKYDIPAQLSPSTFRRKASFPGELAIPQQLTLPPSDLDFPAPRPHRMFSHRPSDSFYVGPSSDVDDNAEDRSVPAQREVGGLYFDMSGANTSRNRTRATTHATTDTLLAPPAPDVSDDVIYMNLKNMRRKDTFPGDIMIPEGFLQRATHEMNF